MTMIVVGFEFTEPELFDVWIKNVPKKSGLYILYSRGEKNNKGIFVYHREYVGQTDDYDGRGWNSHKGLECVRKKLGNKSIYISIHEMPSSTEDEREKRESTLLNDFKPDCNKLG